MNIKPLRNDLIHFLKKRNLSSKFTKQASLFNTNPRHPSLHTEILEPKHLHIYSFRIDKRYRAIFIITNQQAEIIDINLHYH